MSDLTVKFAGDTTALNAAVEQARQAVARFAPQATNQARGGLDQLRASIDQNTAAIQASTSGWKSWLATAADATIVLRGLYDTLSDLTTGMADAARMGQTVGIELRQGLVETARMGQEAGIGLRRAIDDYTDSLAHGVGAARSFITEQQGVAAALARGVLAVEKFGSEIRLGQTDMARIELAAISAAGGFDAFKSAVQAGTFKDTLQSFTAELLQIPDMTDQAAAQIEGMLGSIPNYSQEANEGLIRLIATISANGDAAVANAQKIVAALKDDSAASGQGVAEAVGAIVDGLKDGSLSAEQFSRKMADVNTLTSFFGRTLQPAAATAYFDAISSKLRAIADAQRGVTAENEAALRRLGILGSAIAYTRQSQVAIEKEHVAQLEKAVDLLGKEQEITAGIASAQAREQTFRDTLDKANPINSQIEDVESKITVLQNKLNRGTGDQPALSPDDVKALVRTVAGEAGGESAQGQLAVAAVALNRLANGNFGDSMEKLLKAGNGSQFNVWKPDDPTGKQNLAVDSAEYQRILHEIVQPLVSGDIKSPVGGALNFYNPTTTKPENQFGMNDTTTIGRHKFGTAKNSPDAIPALDEDEVESTTQAVQKLQDELRKLNELKAGGSATSKAELENAQATARGMDDQVEAAKRVLAAKQEELAAVKKTGGTPQAEDAAAKGVAEAQKTLRERQGEQQKAAEALKTAALQEGSRARLDATLAELGQEQAGYASNSAKYLEIEKQKLEAVRAFKKQEAANAVEVEKVRYDAAVKGFAQQKAAIQVNAKDRDLSAEQEMDALKAVADKEEAENRAHFDRLRTIAKEYGTDSVAEVRKTNQSAAEADIKLNDERVKAAREANERIRQSYQQTFEQIGSTVSSSLMSMIEGQSNFRSLLQSVAREMVHMFIQNRVRAVADMAAEQAAKLQEVVAGQSLQTSAVVAGETARTAVAATGAATAAAAKAPAIVASIGASANEAFAGTYGFLAPVMGPLAVVPAAAAEALVMAKAALPSFAVGHMNLPSDMIAQVHAGEMIVPASPAAALRDMMSGGGGGGVTNHITVNHSSHGSRPEAEIKREAKIMAGAIADHLRSASQVERNRFSNATGR